MAAKNAKIKLTLISPISAAHPTIRLTPRSAIGQGGVTKMNVMINGREYYGGWMFPLGK